MALPTTFVIVSLLIQITLSDQSVGTNFIYEHENHPYVVKTVQNEHGDIYDCVDIFKQPSLNHPLLKNHKIQMSSTASFKSVSIYSDSSSISNKTAMKSTTGDKEHLKIKLRHIKCSRGTVPIRRIPKQKKDQVLGRGRGRPTFQTQPHSSDGTKIEPEIAYFAGILTKDLPNKIYYGARATSALYKPKNVKPNQMSGVVVSLQNGGAGFVNRIEVGWMVNPEVFGDDNTRLYTHWTTDDGYSTGCYNLACPGFIVVNSIPLDYEFNETNTPIKHVWHTVFEIGQDTTTGNWWLLLGDDRVKVGYWPKEIVPKLAGGAQVVKMGGLVASPPYELKSPPMGSGNIYAGNNFDKTAYFARIQFVDESQKVINGDNPFIDRAKTRCYLAGDNMYKDYAPKGFSFVLGYSFLYGGPGGDIDGVLCFTPTFNKTKPTYNLS